MVNYVENQSGRPELLKLMFNPSDFTYNAYLVAAGHL